MIFIAVGTISLFVWSILGERRLLSVSFVNLIGTLVFVVLGLELDPDRDIALTILIGIGFYLFLVIGEQFARHVPIDKERFNRFGQLLESQPIFGFVAGLFFIVYGLLPAIQVLTSGQSIGDLFVATWQTNVVSSVSQRLIELSYQQATGFEAFLKGVQSQLIGFWYLSAGVVYSKKSRWFYPVLIAYLFGIFLTSQGFRSLLMASLLLPVLFIMLSAKKAPRFSTIVLIVVFITCIFLALDWLRYGRQGSEATGNIQDRIDRTLRDDFAYGGMGLRLGLNNIPSPPEQGLNYFARMIVLPIPRVLWPDKLADNPNQEYTEAATGRSYANIGTILLFTPLGEALFNFGYLGVLVIPFLYGFVSILLERFYSTSNAYRGLLAQVYIWAFLAMRLTFYNLFLTLVVANFVLICLIIAGSYIKLSYRLSSVGYMQNG